MKRLLFHGLRLCIVVALLELFSYLVLFVVNGKSISLSDISRNKMEILTYDADAYALVNRDLEFGNRKFLQSIFVHPYLGFSLKTQTLYQEVESRLPNLSKWQQEFSIIDGVHPKGRIPPADPDKTFYIGISGGSVAGHFAYRGRTALLEELKQCEILRDKDIEIVCLAVHGYKEPQQLMILNYYLALGGHLDMLINLDGFNEVTLPVTENISKNINPFYPRGWFFISQSMTDRETLSAAGRMIQLLENSKTLARITSIFPFRYSYTAGMIWETYVKHAGKAIVRLQNQLIEVPLTPDKIDQIPDILHIVGDDLIQVWKTCSIQQHILCEGNGIRYFHFLQPNQYVKDSKPLSAKELEIAYDTGFYKQLVEMEYPELKLKGQELVEEGVFFRDMTSVFETVEDTLYEDPCCHFNKEGNQILGHAIGKAIVEDYCQ